MENSISSSDATGARPAFRIEQLRPHRLFGERETAMRQAALHAYFGWESFSDMEAEFKATVGPYYHLVDHHNRNNAKELIEMFLNGTATQMPHGASFRVTLLSPLDVFSLPFRHLHLSEPLAVMSADYGVRYEAPLTLIDVH